MHEVRAAQGDRDFAEVIAESVAQSVDPLTVVEPSGRVVCIFGHVPLGPILTPMAAPWCLATDRMFQHPGDLVRISRAYFADWRERYPLLVNFVDARNTASIRYLKLVGFTLDEPAPFGVAGLPFHRFHMGLAD